MPTVIIHPTQIPDSYITHDGPRARSWMASSSAYRDAVVTTLDQHAICDISETPEPAAYILPRYLIVNGDDRSAFGAERTRREQRHAPTATL